MTLVEFTTSWVKDETPRNTEAKGEEDCDSPFLNNGPAPPAAQSKKIYRIHFYRMISQYVKVQIINDKLLNKNGAAEDEGSRC